jgi:hypothetical protein
MTVFSSWLRRNFQGRSRYLEVAEVGSVDDFVRWVFGQPPTEDEMAFYRGHSKADEYKLVPYVLRSPEQSEAEFRKYQEMLMANPVDFREDANTFERLSRMQHYGLATRMLDTSTNPLIALFFACRNRDGRPSDDYVGDVIRFTIAKTKVKYYGSDTVSCLSNLAQMDDEDRKTLDTTLDRDAFNASKPVTKLLHFIKGEKPYFRDVIEPDDLSRVLCVRARHSNERVTAQSGAFLLFGQGAVLPEYGNADITVRRVKIAKHRKAEIIRQLDTLAINSGTAFRDIATYAEYIKATR